MREEAVSPVIGVMLMIVVTIVIAAAVSGISGDMDLDEKSGPNVILESEIDYTDTTGGDTIEFVYLRDNGHGGTTPFAGGTITSGEYDTHGILFTHVGGDPIDLKDLQFSVYSNNFNIQVDWDTVRRDTPGLVYEIGGTYELYGHEYTCVGYRPTTAGYTEEDIIALGGDCPTQYFNKVNPETSDDTIIRPGEQFKAFVDSGTWSTGWAMVPRNAGGDSTESYALEGGSGSGWILSHKPSGAFLATGDIYWPDTN